MPTPTWLAYAFAVLMVAVSAYCVARIALAASLGRHNRYDVTVAHALMGLGMVGMLVRGWRVVPTSLWVTVFAALAGYFLVRSMSLARTYVPIGSGLHRIGHALIHMTMALAMLYMYWLTGAEPLVRLRVGAMVGPPRGAGDPSLTLLLIVVLIASAIWELDATSRFMPARAVPVAAAHSGTAPPLTAHLEVDRWLAPRLEAWCHIAMCVTMAYMLVVMV